MEWMAANHEDIKNMGTALDCLAFLIANLGNGRVVSEVIDHFPGKKKDTLIPFDLDRCNNFLGTQITQDELEQIFILLNIQLLEKSRGF